MSNLVKQAIKPKTEAEWCAYRCKLNCQAGREVLDGATKIPPGSNRVEYALYNLLHAVEELARLAVINSRPVSNSGARIETKGGDAQ
jgi:hypothetical protein